MHVYYAFNLVATAAARLYIKLLYVTCLILFFQSEILTLNLLKLEDIRDANYLNAL